MEQKDKEKFIICGSTKKKRGDKLGDESDDSDCDTFSSKGKNSKSKRSKLKSYKSTPKVKR